MLVKLCIDPETSWLLLGKLRALTIVIIDNCQNFLRVWRNILANGCCSPLLITAQILLSAWGLGDRKKWIFEVIKRLEVKIQENMAPLNYLQRWRHWKWAVQSLIPLLKSVNFVKVSVIDKWLDSQIYFSFVPALKVRNESHCFESS